MRCVESCHKYLGVKSSLYLLRFCAFQEQFDCLLEIGSRLFHGSSLTCHIELWTESDVHVAFLLQNGGVAISLHTGMPLPGLGGQYHPCLGPRQPGIIFQTHAQISQEDPNRLLGPDAQHIRHGLALDGEKAEDLGR